MRSAILAGQVTNVVRGSSMDDEERLELDEQVEAEELREYRRGLKMLERNPNKEIVEGCPWCNKRNYRCCYCNRAKPCVLLEAKWICYLCWMETMLNQEIF